MAVRIKSGIGRWLWPLTSEHTLILTPALQRGAGHVEASGEDDAATVQGRAAAAVARGSPCGTGGRAPEAFTDPAGPDGGARSLAVGEVPSSAPPAPTAATGDGEESALAGVSPEPGRERGGVQRERTEDRGGAADSQAPTGTCTRRDGRGGPSAARAGCPGPLRAVPCGRRRAVLCAVTRQTASCWPTPGRGPVGYRTPPYSDSTTAWARWARKFAT